MPEGLSATDVGKEIGQHAKHSGGQSRQGPHALHWRSRPPLDRHDRRRVVGVLGGQVGNGVVDARWRRPRPHGRRRTARSRSPSPSAPRTRRRSTPGSPPTSPATRRQWRSPRGASGLEYRVAFEAWLATDPFTNPDAPPGRRRCPSTCRRAWPNHASWTGGRPVPRRRRGRRGDLGRVRTDNRHPRERALPRRHQHAAPAAGRALRAHRRGHRPAGLRGRVDPAAAAAPLITRGRCPRRSWSERPAPGGRDPPRCGRRSPGRSSARLRGSARHVRERVAGEELQVAVALVDPEREARAALRVPQLDARAPSWPRTRSVKAWSSFVAPIGLGRRSRARSPRRAPSRPGGRARPPQHGRAGSTQDQGVDGRRPDRQVRMLAAPERARVRPMFVAVVRTLSPPSESGVLDPRARARTDSRAAAGATCSRTTRCGACSPTVQSASRTRPWIAFPRSGSVSGSRWLRPSNS